MYNTLVYLGLYILFLDGPKQCPDGSKCYNNGNCIGIQGRPPCKCPDEYSGTFCEHS